MRFDLLLDTGHGAGERDVGENVLLTNLPNEYQCYALYYPGPMPDPQLEAALRKIGEAAGQNLFVNIGRLNDPNYGKIANLFEIKRNPVIIFTALAPLAAPEKEFLNAFVRLDSPKLLASTERCSKCVNKVFNHFMRGDVAGAIANAKWKERSELIHAIGESIRGALGFLWDFISERDISVSVAEGRFELTKAGGE
jgi:hypothetical protein